MKQRVIVTRHYLPEAAAELARRFDVTLVEGSGRTLIQTLESHPECRALITFLSDRVDGEVLKHAPRLNILANYAVGYNNIDVDRALERGIFVTHTPDILTDATADLTMALILAVARRVVEADRFMRSGSFKGWESDLMLGRGLRGRVLGIVGLGRIGEATARRARAFGMDVIYYDHHRKADLERTGGVQYVRFTDLIRDADVVSPHIPYSPDVHHLFNRDVFSLMKRDAIFVNVARGSIMDEQALCDALEAGALFGAGLDVYEFEPRVNEGLKKLDNVVMVPHIGSATRRARMAMATMTIESVSDALAGKTPRHLIPEWRERSAAGGEPARSSGD